MLILNFTNLPQELVYLCKQNLNSSNYKNLVEKTVKNNKFLSMIINNNFSQLGWLELRNKLTEFYLGKLFYGYFSPDSSEDLLDEINKIEECYHKFSINGFSRLYLLGLFISFHNFSASSSEDGSYRHLELDPRIIELLSLSKVKVEKIDYLILFLHQLIKITSYERTLNLIKLNKSFNNIFDTLEMQEQKIIHHNFLSYSASIFESDFFIYNKV